MVLTITTYPFLTKKCYTYLSNSKSQRVRAQSVSGVM